MKRESAARLLNLLAPGAGLILLRREWLGLALAVAFTALAQVAMLGWWVIPLDIPAWLSGVAGLSAGVIWAQAQWLVHRRARWVAAPAFAQELADLRRRAAEALARGAHEEARRLLVVARSVNDEDEQVAAMWAKIQARGD